MIRIEICHAHGGIGGYYHSVGHAGAGNEKICLAVTAIEECLAANLEGTWNVRTRRTAESGTYSLWWNKTDRYGKGLPRANSAAGFAYNGLKALARQYPEIVKVEWRRPETERRA